MKYLVTTTDNRILTYAVSILFSLAMGTLTAISLPSGDDIYYASIYKAYITGDSPFPGLAPWLDFFRHHAETFNGRFGDKLLPLYMCLSPILRAAISALTVFATLLYSCRLVFGHDSMRHTGSVAVGACMILLMPWYDTGLLSCMFINYELGFLVALMWVWYYVSPRRLTKRNTAPLLLLSLLAGSWHEGFSVPLWAGAVIPLLMHKELRTRKAYLLAAGLTAGILFTVTCPGFWVRFDREFGNIIFFKSDLIVGGSLPAMGVIAAIFMLWRRYISEKQSYLSGAEASYLTAYIVLVAVSAAIILTTNSHLFRAWWLADGLSVIILFRACRNLKMSRQVKNAFIVLTAIFALVNLASSVKHQYLIFAEAKQIIAQYLKTPDGLVYHDISAPGNVSLLTLRKVQRDFYTCSYSHPRHPRASALRVLPKEFRNMSSLRLNAFPQEGGQKFSRSPGGRIILHGERPEGFATLRYKDSRGKSRLMRITCKKIPATRDDTITYIETLPYIWEGSPDIAIPIEVF